MPECISIFIASYVSYFEMEFWALEKYIVNVTLKDSFLKQFELDFFRDKHFFCTLHNH